MSEKININEQTKEYVPLGFESVMSGLKTLDPENAGFKSSIFEIANYYDDKKMIALVVAIVNDRETFNHNETYDIGKCLGRAAPKDRAVRKCFVKDMIKRLYEYNDELIKEIDAKDEDAKITLDDNSINLEGAVEDEKGAVTEDND